MKSPSALFLVQTPLHLLNALEAITKFNIASSTFFIVTSQNNEKWRSMIETLLPPAANTHFCIRNDHDIEKGTKAYAQYIGKLKNECFDFVFFADARLYIFVDIVNSLRVEDSFLMDDGTGTLLAIHSLNKYGCYYDLSVSRSSERNKCIEATKIKYGLWNLSPVNYKLFTVFDYQSCKYFDVVPNPMKQLQYVHTNIDPETIIFIGQPFVKINHMTESHYLQCLYEVGAFFKGKKIAYLPHPRDTQDFIDTLTKSGTFSIVNTQLTAEKYLMQCSPAPETVCGFLSTSLWNIAKFQQGINVLSFKIPDELFNKHMSVNRSRSSRVTDLEFIHLIYEYYKKRLPIHELKAHSN